MRTKSDLLMVFAAIGLSLLLEIPVEAQNINITTPFQSIGESNFGSAGHLNLNGRRRDGSGFSTGFNFAKGSTRSSVTNAPSLTVYNGFGGSIASGQIRPFVTGFVPVVGNQAFGPLPVDNAVTRAINSGQLNLNSPALPLSTSPTHSASNAYDDVPSSATQGDLSVDAIKAQRTAAIEMQQLKLQQKIAEARRLVEQGERSLARSAFRDALRLTDDPQEERRIKSEIEATRN